MGDGPVVHQLGLPCLAVQVHGDGIAMERGPRSLCQSRRQRPNSMWELLRDSSGSQSIGQPFGVNLGAFYDMAGFEDVAQFVEQPVDAVITRATSIRCPLWWRARASSWQATNKALKLIV
jgi:hypothetical protein